MDTQECDGHGASDARKRNRVGIDWKLSETIKAQNMRTHAAIFIYLLLLNGNMFDKLL